MRIPLFLVLAVIPAAAQTPLVQIRNASRPNARDFQIGDHFEILITAAPDQPISVRTMRQGRTDWGPIIGSTDETGRWSTGRKLEWIDVGAWREIWTVGGKLASPAIQFSVNAGCLPGGQTFVSSSGPNSIVTCDTADGPQTFRTIWATEPFRTPDGRFIAAARPDKETARQYDMERLQYYIGGGAGADRVRFSSPQGAMGDETADLIREVIGPNALSENETRNVLAILRAAFAKPETIQPSAQEPIKTLLLLQHLEDLNRQASAGLKREIAETIADVQAR